MEKHYYRFFVRLKKQDKLIGEMTIQAPTFCEPWKLNEKQKAAITQKVEKNFCREPYFYLKIDDLEVSFESLQYIEQKEIDLKIFKGKITKISKKIWV